jgi:acrylyl-CoA reductase (NADPH)
MAPMAQRERAWELIVKHLPLDLLHSLTEEVGFDELPDLGKKILEGQVRGRLVVKIPS